MITHEGYPYRYPNSRLVPRPISFRRWSEYSIPFIISLNFGLCIALSLLLNVWIDEVFSLQATGKDFYYALNRAVRLELQPPLYFVLLYFWRKLNTSIFFARLFSVLCISVTVYVSARLSRRFLRNIHCGWIAAMVAFHPLTIYAAVEIRMYALVILLSALLLLFFYDGYLCETPNLRARNYYLLSSILGLYTQCFLGFLLLANASVLLVLRRWKPLRAYLLGMIIVGVTFVPMLYVLFGQLAELANSRINNAATHITVLEGTKFLFNRIGEYVLPLHWRLAESISFSWLRTYFFRSAVAIGLFVLMKKKRFHATPPHDFALFGILAMVSLCFIAIRNIVSLEFLRPYHTAVLLLPVIYSALWLISLCTNENLFRIMVGFLSGYFVFTLGLTYVHPGKLGDSARIASYITQNEKACEPILFFRNEEFQTVSIYYSGSNKLVPIPDYPNSEKYSLREQALKDEKDIVSSLSKVTCQFETFWLVTALTEPHAGIDFHPEILEKFVEEHCSVIRTKEFQLGAKVRLLARNKEVPLSSGGLF